MTACDTPEFRMLKVRSFFEEGVGVGLLPSYWEDFTPSSTHFYI